MEVNKKVLLIDDQKEILESLKKLLTGKESLRNITSKLNNLVKDFFEEESNDRKFEEIYDVHTAERGEEGFDLVKKANEAGEPYSLVTVDMRMPGWDGLKTATEIRRVDPNIEIVIVTAYSDRKREELLEQIGSPEKLLYLKKPFDREEILQLFLSLTLKWTLEREVETQFELIKNMNQGLEKAIFGIDKIEKIKPPKLDLIINEILNQLVQLIDLKGGFIGRLKGLSIEPEIVIGNIDTNLRIGFDEISNICHEKCDFYYKDEYLVVPFWDGDEIISVAITETEKDQKISGNRLKLLKIFISHANNLIKNAKLYTKLDEANKELLERNEKLKRANELNKKFLVVSSHELRTPITLISGYSQLLESGMYKDEEGKQKIYSGLKTASDRLIKLINQMLEMFAISDKGEKIIFKHDYFDFREIFNDLKEKVRSFLEIRKQNLVLDIEENMPKIFIDKEKIINFVLFNLTLNSIKSSEDGKTIKITCKYDKEKNKALIIVKDSGIGIPNEDLEEIFSPFYVTGDEKYHHSGSYEYKSSGIGLGLTIVKNILNLIDEDIECVSKENEGTEFKFTLSV